MERWVVVMIVPRWVTLQAGGCTVMRSRRKSQARGKGSCAAPSGECVCVQARACGWNLFVCESTKSAEMRCGTPASRKSHIQHTCSASAPASLALLGTRAQVTLVPYLRP